MNGALPTLPTGHRCECFGCEALAIYQVLVGKIPYELCEHHALYCLRAFGGVAVRLP